jgi:hypothetical protein
MRANPYAHCHAYSQTYSQTYEDANHDGAYHDKAYHEESCHERAYKVTNCKSDEKTYCQPLNGPLQRVAFTVVDYGHWDSELDW